MINTNFGRILLCVILRCPVVRHTIEFRDMVLAEGTSALKKDSPKVVRVCHGVYMPSLQDSLPVVMFVSTDMPPLTA